MSLRSQATPPLTADFVKLRFLTISAERLSLSNERKPPIPVVAETKLITSSAVEIEQVGGWRISADMSEEKRAKVLELIGAVPASTTSNGDRNTQSTTTDSRIEQIGGWRISADMSDEKRAKVLEMIGVTPPPAASDSKPQTSTTSNKRVEQVGGWRISADMSEEKRARILAMIGATANSHETERSNDAPNVDGETVEVSSSTAHVELVPGSTQLPIDALEPQYDAETGNVLWMNTLREHQPQDGASNSENQWHISPHLQGERRERILALIGQNTKEANDTDSTANDTPTATALTRSKPLVGTWRVSANASPEFRQRIAKLLEEQNMVHGNSNSTTSDS